MTALLASRYQGQRLPGKFDRVIGQAVRGALASHQHLLSVMLLITNPAVVTAAIVVTALVATLRRRFGVAILAVTGPALTMLLIEFVAKPLVDRHYYGGYLCYPSGHTGIVVSLLTVLVVAAWAGGRRLPRLLAAVAWPLLTAATGIALVGGHYHYPTDIAGGVCLAVGTVLTLHLLIVAARRGHADGSTSASRDSAVSSPPINSSARTSVRRSARRPAGMPAAYEAR